MTAIKALILKTHYYIRWPTYQNQLLSTASTEDNVHTEIVAGGVRKHVHTGGGRR